MSQLKIFQFKFATGTVDKSCIHVSHSCLAHEALDGSLRPGRVQMSDDEMGISPPASPPAYDAGSFDDGALPKGVKKTVITAGSGWEKPKKLYEVKVNLKGKHGETIFDTNETENLPRTYVVGSGLPCKGLDAFFKDMKKGEKASVVIEAGEAFGSAGIPEKGVPADAEVTYEVELIDWQKIDDISKKKDGSILVKTLVEGPEWEKPKDNDISFLRYRGRVQVQHPLSFTIRLILTVNKRRMRTLILSLRALPRAQSHFVLRPQILPQQASFQLSRK